MNRKRKIRQFGADRIKKILSSEIVGAINGIDIDIKSDREIYVDGCIGVDEFTDEKVVFLGKEIKVTVFGDKLELYTFSGGCIKASGVVKTVEIERGIK